MDVFDALTPLAAKRLRASALDAYAQAYFDRLRVQGYAALTVRLRACLPYREAVRQGVGR